MTDNIIVDTASRIFADLCEPNTINAAEEGKWPQELWDALEENGLTLTWVPEDFLATQWKVEELDFPPWSPMSGDTAAASLTSTARAQKAGLKIRPMQETVADTMTWFHSLPAERQAKLRAGIDPQKEADVLKAWHAKGGAKKSA